MTITGQNVIDQLDLVFFDNADAKWTDAQKLAAVNIAIDSGWPELFTVAIDTSITLAGATYSYTPSATPEGGFRVAYVTWPASPDTLLRRIFQRQSGTAWEIVVPFETATGYSGQTLRLQYQARCARLTAASDSIDSILPMDYLWQAAAMTLAAIQMVKGASFETSPYEALVVAWTKGAAIAKRNAAAALRPLPNMIHDVGDAVSSHAYNRFGWRNVHNP